MTDSAVPFVVIYGPTASGKTDLSLTLTDDVACEFISADSRQIYRGLNIGTNKISPDIRRRIPHHLIDIVDITAAYNAHRFADTAERLISRISARGRLPVIVGGTSLYLQALLYGLSPAPDRDEAVRERLMARERETPGALYTRLRGVDPEYAKKIHAHDKVRQLRALEVYELTGTPLSRYAPVASRPRLFPLFIRLSPPRDKLKAVIQRRSRRMVEDGLIEETRQALADGASPDAPGLCAIGYRETIEYLEGHLGGREDLIGALSRHTWRYAKRQLCWFRDYPGMMEMTAPIAETARAAVRKYLAGC